MKNTKKTQKRLIFTQLSLKTITTPLVLIILICSGAIASSGISVATNNTMQEQQKTLTRNDIGVLLLSLSLTIDREQRLFLQQTVQQLILKGELTEEQVQNLANNSFEKGPEIFHFEEININGPGIVISFPGTLAAFLNKEIASLFIFQRGNVEVRTNSYEMIPFLVIGFYGLVESSRNPRVPNMWHFFIKGNCIMIII